MTLTVRLPEDLETALDRHCTATGKTRSLVVNESLAAYLVTQSPAPHDLWAPFKPAQGSGRGDLATRHSAVLKEKLRARHARPARG